MTKFKDVVLPMRPSPRWPAFDLHGPDRGTNCYSGAQMLEYGSTCAEAQRKADEAQGDKVSETVTEPAKLRKEFREQFDLGAALDDIKERLDKLEEKRGGVPTVNDRMTSQERALREMAKRIDEITARIDPADFKEWVRANAEAHRRLDDLEELERKRASFHAAAEKFAR